MLADMDPRMSGQREHIREKRERARGGGRRDLEWTAQARNKHCANVVVVVVVAAVQAGPRRVSFDSWLLI
jgi:hypothetical protein